MKQKLELCLTWILMHVEEILKIIIREEGKRAQMAMGSLYLVER